MNNFKIYNLIKCEKLVNKLNSNYKVNEKSFKLGEISVECNAFDVNEDKQRQCYKQLKCFWPKRRYSSKYESDLNRHNLQHLNERQFLCDKCSKQFHNISTLIQHKRYFHSNERYFDCPKNHCIKSFKRSSDLIKFNIIFIQFVIPFHFTFNFFIFNQVIFQTIQL